MFLHGRSRGEKWKDKASSYYPSGYLGRGRGRYYWKDKNLVGWLIGRAASNCLEYFKSLMLNIYKILSWILFESLLRRTKIYLNKFDEVHPWVEKVISSFNTANEYNINRKRLNLSFGERFFVSRFILDWHFNYQSRNLHLPTDKSSPSPAVKFSNWQRIKWSQLSSIKKEKFVPAARFRGAAVGNIALIARYNSSLDTEKHRIWSISTTTTTKTTTKTTTTRCARGMICGATIPRFLMPLPRSWAIN